ncbi:MAG TPA: hypothetical protein VN088_12000 [Nocardioides sp.]|nr:hypothetical protein [Nocardioides sp.]
MIAVIAGTALLTGVVHLVTHHRGDGSHEGSSIARDTPATHARAHHPRRHHRRVLPVDPATSATADAGSLELPLGGGNPQVSVTFVPGVPHHAVLRVTTSGAPAGIRYAFRTSAGVRSTDARTTNRSWTAADTVRGIEPLAGVIAQVASGTVSCTVTIDGRVVDTKTSSGRFAIVSCYG